MWRAGIPPVSSLRLTSFLSSSLARHSFGFAGSPPVSLRRHELSETWVLTYKKRGVLSLEELRPLYSREGRSCREFRAYETFDTYVRRHSSS